MRPGAERTDGGQLVTLRRDFDPGKPGGQDAGRWRPESEPRSNARCVFFSCNRGRFA
jgi:hypothetical protein